MGYTSLKGDVRLTSDNKIIMCHDAGFTLDSDNNVTKYDINNNTPIINMSFSECLSLKFPNGDEVVDFETYIKICKKYGKIAFVTVRDDNLDVVIPLVLSILEKYNMIYNSIINCFTQSTLEQVRKQNKTIMLSRVLTYGRYLDNTLVDEIKVLGNVLINLFSFNSSSTDVSILENSKNGILYAKSNGIRVYEAQVPNTISIYDLMEYGITGCQVLTYQE